MKKMLYSLLLSATLFLWMPHLQAEQPHLQHAFRLLAEESVLLNTRLSMQIIGCGGIFNDSIESLEIVIQVPGRMDLAKARLVFTAIMQDWLKRLNGDRMAMPFYRNYPMTINNLELRMMLTDYDERSNANQAKIALLFNLGDKIVYCYRNNQGTLCPFLRENYCDAVKAIEKQLRAFNRKG